ncbi:caspase family protein [Sulfitobacter sp. SK011]|uniref:caspase family protein n=1 Tax=Sulfitobacter sp. SK011 TaxID=1389004 RepID=UPI0013B4692A|nr:caspase family protein [Sulfitobacter sp. SK011]
MFRLMVLTCVMLLSAFPALAEKRTAFIVGNADYSHVLPLANPVSDARLMAGMLEELGFEVTLAVDLTRAGLASEFSDFLEQTEGADVTLFYYAGHGMQFEGRNYLLGTDAALKSAFDVQSEALPLDRLVQMLEEKARAALVFIDACRDNPLATEFYTRNFSPTRALATRGLAPMTGRFQGSMLMFAASPGQVAYDGASDNSPFAQALARHLPTENVEILTLMKRVIRDVKTDTENLQTPTVTNDLSLEVYLNLGTGGQGAALAAAQEEAIFEAALAINSERAWDIYLQRFPAGSMRELALVAREELTAQVLASAPGSVVADSGRVTVARDTAASAELSLGLSQDDARAVQAALNSRGYNAGPEDGAIGQRTRRAIADFQAATKLPSTGVVTRGTAEALRIVLAEPEKSDRIIYASKDARKYDPDQLALIETDERLLNAARVLKGKEIVYGFFQGRVYVAMLNWEHMDWDGAIALSKAAGGHLVTITSPEENSFVFNLIAQDDRFWLQATVGTRLSEAVGPHIGLYQPPGSREPAGGWRWVTNEPLAYTNWKPNNLDNYADREHLATFYNNQPFKSGSVKTPPSPEWNDIHTSIRSLIIEID